jgi:hypothetical protein
MFMKYSGQGRRGMAHSRSLRKFQSGPGGNGDGFSPVAKTKRAFFQVAVTAFDNAVCGARHPVLPAFGRNSPALGPKKFEKTKPLKSECLVV